jgi:cyclophilin family peptidyl-prolyl cis-trans isomerase/FKBP-type peptidyl-prolyl cis-trans isomerase
MMRHRSTTIRFGLCAVAGVFVLASCGDSTSDVPVAEAEQADDGPDATTGADATADEADEEEASAESTEPAGESASDGTTPPDPASGKPAVELPAELPVGLVVTELIEGTGDAAENGDTVELFYVGVLSADGTEFDNNYDSGLPFPLTLGSSGVIPGFEQGLLGARLGSRIQMDIPAGLAYGDQGAGDIIKPGDAITFVVDVTAVTKPVPVTAPPMADPSECPATDGSEPQQREFDQYPPFCIDVTKTYTAEFATNFGNITIGLDPQKAPLTVNNFVMLAWFGYFDGTECHRAIPGFVVQCGDPTATGTGGPGYQFADELPLAGEYQLGSIAMANSGPDTNGSQFFIITGADGAALPPQYSLFGQVVAGDTTVAEMDGVANPENNGVPPLDRILIDSVTITVS